LLKLAHQWNTQGKLNKVAAIGLAALSIHILTPAAENLRNSGKLSRTFTMAFASKMKG
jgi:hypothetical protein